MKEYLKIKDEEREPFRIASDFSTLSPNRNALLASAKRRKHGTDYQCRLSAADTPTTDEAIISYFRGEQLDWVDQIRDLRDVIDVGDVTE